MSEEEDSKIHDVTRDENVRRNCKIHDITRELLWLNGVLPC